MPAFKYYLPFFFFLFLQPLHSAAQQSYWQQKTDFKISVTLNDEEKSLKGNLILDYFNNSPDTLRFIYFHLWPNAFKNDRTAFSSQMLRLNKTDFYFSGDEEKGYINQLQFSANNKVLKWEQDAANIDLAKVFLDAPLIPGSRITIATPFNVKLPYAYSRPGYVNDEFLVTQWYPKPAVYDMDGWHPMPYLHYGECYNNFGDYQVTIRAKKEYTIAATGTMIDSTVEAGLSTLVFQQKNVTDFAWFALKNVIHLKDTVHLANKVVSMNLYYGKDNAENWKNAFHFAKRSLHARTKWIGEYPFDVVSIVERPGKQSTGGMEYPTITLLDSIQNEEVLDMLIDHEVGHNWYQAAIATNERDHPWMDEGFNSFYDNRYKKRFRDSTTLFNHKAGFINKRMPDDPVSLALKTVTKIQADQPINTPSEAFTELNYGLIPYQKTANWLEQIEEKIGTEKFDRLMQTYYKLWKFRHPQPADFLWLADSLTDVDLGKDFDLLNQTGELRKQTATKKLQVSSFFNLKDAARNNYLLFSPAFGYNLYNGLMAGIAVHNYSLPLPSLRFVAVPLYAFGSGELQGIGRIGYTKYFERNASLEFHLSASRFKKEKYMDSVNTEHLFGFQKFSPGMKYVFPQNGKDKRLRTSLSYNYFSIRETNLLFVQDPVSHNYNLTFPKTNFGIHRASLLVENYRKLYPYDFKFEMDAGKAFLRPTVTGNYFFNYAGGGGVSARIFAGKFFYTQTKTAIRQFELKRFNLNMSAPGGFYDYAYSDYFIGRNEFEGFYARQRIEKDGNFKVNTDLLSSQVGISDDWLAAINFTTTLPNKIYPFQKFLPIRLFLDVGTNGEWMANRSGAGRLLYDAGLQFSAFNELLKVNLPILYSKPFQDYYKNIFPDNKWINTISFSISLDNDLLKKQLPELRF